MSYHRTETNSTLCVCKPDLCARWESIQGHLETGWNKRQCWVPAGEGRNRHSSWNRGSLGQTLSADPFLLAFLCYSLVYCALIDIRPTPSPPITINRHRSHTLHAHKKLFQRRSLHSMPHHKVLHSPLRVCSFVFLNAYFLISRVNVLARDKQIRSNQWTPTRRRTHNHARTQSQHRGSAYLCLLLKGCFI